jgi:peptidoglycan/xylan/chitin deacetylase (PgdA/CDA1 family)
MAITLLYHDIVPPGNDDFSGFAGPGAARYKLSPEEFQKHLQAITTVVPHGTATDDDRLLLTFDDGGASAWDIAELLEAHGWRGHFFITTNCIGKPTFLTAEQIRALHRRGHLLGSHSHTHPARMSSCSREELQHEWRTSCTTLADLLGEPVTTASVPGGFYSRAVAEAAAHAGIRLLFNSEPTMRWEEVNGCRIAGRYTVYRGMTAEAVAALAAGRRAPQLRQALSWNLKKLAKAVGGRAYLSLRQLLLARAYAPSSLRG